MCLPRVSLCYRLLWDGVPSLRHVPLRTLYLPYSFFSSVGISLNPRPWVDCVAIAYWLSLLSVLTYWFHALKVALLLVRLCCCEFEIALTSQPTLVSWVSVILTIVALIFECAMWFQGVICIAMSYASCNLGNKWCWLVCFQLYFVLLNKWV